MKKVTTRYRITLYGIITLGFGIMGLFRSRLAHHLPWGESLWQSGKKILLYAGIFAAIEGAYFIYQKIKEKKGNS